MAWSPTSPTAVDVGKFGLLGPVQVFSAACLAGRQGGAFGWRPQFLRRNPPDEPLQSHRGAQQSRGAVEQLRRADRLLLDVIPDTLRGERLIGEPPAN